MWEVRRYNEYDTYFSTFKTYCIIYSSQDSYRVPFGSLSPVSIKNTARAALEAVGHTSLNVPVEESHHKLYIQSKHSNLFQIISKK